MGLQQAYAKSIAMELHSHAVWQPGDPFRLGDYGTISKGLFRKLGNIHDGLGITFEHEAGSKAFWEHTSDGVTTIMLSDKEQLPVLLADATLKISFAKANSLFIRANDTTYERISNLYEVAVAARKHRAWDFSWKIVSGLRQASPLIVLMNSQSSSSITLVGKLDILTGILSGVIQSESNLAITGDTALKYIGTRGPFLLDLVKVNRFPALSSGASFGFISLDSPAIDKPFESVSPTSVSYDDEA